LQRALWYFEYTARSHFVDVRWPLMATIAETLLSTSDDATRNFVKRVPQVAERLGLRISKRDVSEMWRTRSKIIHGAAARALSARDLALYALLEDLIRVMLRTALLDRKFRKVFSADESINEAFPIQSRPPKMFRCPNCKATSPIPVRLPRKLNSLSCNPAQATRGFRPTRRPWSTRAPRSTSRRSPAGSGAAADGW
jgi:hypothetical protein